MTSQALPPVAGIAQRLSDSDYDHKLGLAVLARAEQKSWALAVLVVQTGEVLASDGWFIEEEPRPVRALGDGSTGSTTAVLDRQAQRSLARAGDSTRARSSALQHSPKGRPTRRRRYVRTCPRPRLVRPLFGSVLTGSTLWSSRSSLRSLIVRSRAEESRSRHYVSYRPRFEVRAPLAAGWLLPLVRRPSSAL